MAGHSKWSKVKHIKAREDAKKGKIFSKCAHEIALAARGGGDPDLNPRLRAAIDNAKAVSMPKENIERAIKKGAGELGGDTIQEVTYESYGPSGTAFLVEVATDNLNRAAADIRTILTRNNGTIATPGSVAYQFDRRGEIIIPDTEPADEPLLEAAIDAGADDIRGDAEGVIILTAPAQLAQVAKGLRDAGFRVTSEKFVSLPQNPLVLTDEAVARQAIRLFEALDDYDDTLNVFTNFEIDDSLLAALEA
jgi:YebC/PmpR family DNA-binding regulatory protein